MILHGPQRNHPHVRSLVFKLKLGAKTRLDARLSMEVIRERLKDNLDTYLNALFHTHKISRDSWAATTNEEVFLESFLDRALTLIFPGTLRTDPRPPPAPTTKPTVPNLTHTAASRCFF